MNTAQVLFQKLHFNFGKFSFSPTYIEAGVTLLLIFLLILTVASLRRHLVDWSLKGALVGIFFGFLLALILEGFLVIGGKTALTEVLGWKNPSKLLAGALDAGRSQLIKVLGVQTSIPISSASSVKINPTMEDAISLFQSLNPQAAESVRKLICK